MIRHKKLTSKRLFAFALYFKRARLFLACAMMFLVGSQTSFAGTSQIDSANKLVTQMMVDVESILAKDLDDDMAYLAPSHTLGDTAADPARLIEAEDTSDSGKAMLFAAIKQLDSRSQDILQCRWLDEKKATLQELAERYQVSAERIRQLEANAMKKLKALIESY